MGGGNWSFDFIFLQVPLLLMLARHEAAHLKEKKQNEIGI